MFNLDERQQAAIAALMILVGVLLWFFGFKYFASKDAILKGRKNAMKDEITLKTERISSLPLAKTGLITASSQIASLKKAIPTGSSIPQLILQITGIAKNNSTVLSIAPSVVSETISSGGTNSSVQAAPAGLKKINVSVSIVTTYEGLKIFIANAERSLRPLAIQSFSFSAPESANKPINVSIQAVTYYK